MIVFDLSINRFNPVVGGGANGSVIHYSRNDQKVSSFLQLKLISDGQPYYILCYSVKLMIEVGQIGSEDLVLMDVGCELHGYLSDLTRTWPPGGRFSKAQVCFLLLVIFKPLLLQQIFVCMALFVSIRNQIGQNCCILTGK